MLLSRRGCVGCVQRLRPEAAVTLLSRRGCVKVASRGCRFAPEAAVMLLSRRGCVKVASRGCRFAFVQARSRFLSTYWFLSNEVVSWPFHIHCRFRWCLAVSHPWPRSCIFAFVQARLRHVFGLRTGALFFSFRGSKGATSHPCE